MRNLFVLLLAAIGLQAHADVSCEIIRQSRTGIYDEIVHSFRFTGEANEDDVHYVYLKSNGQIATLNREQIEKKKDFSDLNGSMFYTFKRTGVDNVEIVYGDVSTKRKDVRKMISMTDASVPLALWADGRFRVVASCTSSVADPGPK